MSWPPAPYGRDQAPRERLDGTQANNRSGTYRDYLLARNANSVFTGYLSGGGEPTAPSLSLGERVVWLQDEGAAELGSVRWIGRLPTLEQKDWSVGVEFDRPIGNGNGRFAGKQYFIARNNHAIFMPIMTLMKAEEFFGAYRNGTRKLEKKSFSQNDTLHVPGASPQRVHDVNRTSNAERQFCTDGAYDSTACLCPVHPSVNGPAVGEGQQIFLTSTPRGHRHKSLKLRESGGRHWPEEWSDEDFASWNSSHSVVSCPAAFSPGTILMEVTSDSSDSDRDKGKFRTLMACLLPGSSRSRKKRKQRKRKKFVLTSQPPSHYSFVTAVKDEGLRSSESCSAFSSCKQHACSNDQSRRNVSCSVLDTRHSNSFPPGRCGYTEKPPMEDVHLDNIGANTSVQFKKKRAPLPPRPDSPLATNSQNDALLISRILTTSPLASTKPYFNSLPRSDNAGHSFQRSSLTNSTSHNLARNSTSISKVPTEDDQSYTGNLVLIGNQRPLNRLYQTKSLNALQKPDQNSSSNAKTEERPCISPYPRRRTSKKKAPMPPAQAQRPSCSGVTLAVPQLTFRDKQALGNETERVPSLDVSTDDDRVDSPSRPDLPRKTVSHDSLALFGYSSDSLKRTDTMESKNNSEKSKDQNLIGETKGDIKVKLSTSSTLTQTSNVSKDEKGQSISPKTVTRETKECQTLDILVTPKTETQPTVICTVKDDEKGVEVPKKKEESNSSVKKKSKKGKHDEYRKEEDKVKEILSEIEQVVKSKPTVRDFVTAFNRFTEKAEKIASDYNTESANMDPTPKPDPPKKISVKPLNKIVVKETNNPCIKSHSTKWTFNQAMEESKLNISFTEADEILQENRLQQQEIDRVFFEEEQMNRILTEDKIRKRRKSSKKYPAPPTPSLTDPPSPTSSPKLNNLDAGPSKHHRYTSGMLDGIVAAEPAGDPSPQTRATLRQLASFQRQHRRAISVGDLSEVNGNLGDQGRWTKHRPWTPELQPRNGPGGLPCVGKPPLPLRALELSGGSPALFLELEEAIARGEHKRAAALARELALHKVLQARPKKNSQSRKPAEEQLVTVSLYVEDKDTHQGPIPLTIYPSMTVAVLKDKVERDLGFGIHCQRWILGKTFVVDETRTLGSLDVCSPGCPIFLYIVQPKGPDDEDEIEEEKMGATAMRMDQMPSPSLARSPVRSPVHLEAQLETLLEEAADQSASLPIGDEDSSSENSDTGRVEVWSAGSTEIVGFTPTDEDEEDDAHLQPTTKDPKPNSPNFVDERPKSRSSSRPGSAVPRLSYAQLVALEDQDLIPNAETFDCPVCFTAVEPDQGVVLRDCLHLFCRECLTHSVEYSEDAVIKCPFRNEEYSCDSHLLEREIKALVSPTLFEKHLQRSMAAAESRAQNSFHCKTADCPGWCLFEDNVNTFACPVCACVNCLTCAAIHGGKDCRQYQDELYFESAQSDDARKTKEYFDSMMSEGKAMRCPTCRVIVMKKWGCDWLKCSVCQTEICWVTKGPRWGPAGRGDTSGGCKCMINKVRCHKACNYCH